MTLTEREDLKKLLSLCLDNTILLVRELFHDLVILFKREL